LGNPRRSRWWRAIVVPCCACAALPAHAGAVHGLLTRGGQPLAGVQVVLNCGGLQSAGQSGPQGQYSLTIAASGRCTLTVNGASAEVPVTDQPTRVDFEVPAGGSSLIRR
jgi:hypothetical protein